MGEAPGPMTLVEHAAEVARQPGFPEGKSLA
jgi:hypothetical protein